MQPRGLQWSSPLECVPGDNGNTAPTLLNIQFCAENMHKSWPGRSKHFNATNHAKDLHELMSAYDREIGSLAPKLKKYIFGVSYGTYVVQRFMSIQSAHSVSAVVLDFVFASVYARFQSSEVAYSDQLLSLFDQCDQQVDDCGRHFLDFSRQMAVSNLNSVVSQFRRGDGPSVKCAVDASAVR